MLGRISAMEGCSKNSNRTATRMQTGSMSSGINAFGKTTDHRPVSLGKSSAQCFRHPTTVSGGTPRPHHSNRLL